MVKKIKYQNILNEHFILKYLPHHILKDLYVTEEKPYIDVETIASPIIYLIKKSKNTNYNGLLPKDKEPEDELLLHLIQESDWLEPNTLSNQS